MHACSHGVESNPALATQNSYNRTFPECQATELCVLLGTHALNYTHVATTLLLTCANTSITYSLPFPLADSKALETASCVSLLDICTCWSPVHAILTLTLILVSSYNALYEGWSYNDKIIIIMKQVASLKMARYTEMYRGVTHTIYQSNSR